MEQIVFDNKLIRRLILTKYIELKYKSEVEIGIKDIVISGIKKKWHRYCSCTKCKSAREYQLAYYGEIL